MRYFIELSYDGKNYHGWQMQPNAITIQEVLEKAITTLLRTNVTMTGAGRTDAGVHAKQMFAHIDLSKEIDTELLKNQLNNYLPVDIAIHRIFEVVENAHARFDATARKYEYWVTQNKDPFLKDTAYYIKASLNIDLMNQAASELLYYNDFQCFSKSNTDVKTYICDIREARWKLKEDKLVFHIIADRFLRNMVRAIVGTLIAIGTGKTKLSDLKNIIESKNRSNAGVSVPAHGLYLTEIHYPKQIEKK